MTDPIEAMLSAFNGGLIHRDDPNNPRGFTTFYDPKAAMTAAYAALRETLVPVGWVHEHERGESVLSRKPMTRGADELGWTETPLYALPEIKP